MFKVGDRIRCACDGNNPCSIGIEDAVIISINFEFEFYNTTDGSVDFDNARMVKQKQFISHSPLNKPRKESV